MDLDNIDKFLDVRSPEKLTQNLKRIFSKLLDPDEDPTFMLKYMDAIKARLEIRRTVETHAIGLDGFGKACVSAGIVKTTSEFVKLYPPSTSLSKEIYMAQYKTLSFLYYLFVAGAVMERATLVDQILSHGVVGVLLHALLHHHLYTLRYLAAEIIITVSSSVTLPVRVTPAVTSGIVVGLCQLALEGSERLIEQLNTPALDWIWELPWKVAMPILTDPVDVANDLAHFQEFIVSGVCLLLRTEPPLTCRHRLELLKGEPKILDLLFDCAIIPRPSLFPTSLVCSVACDTLILLFQWPSHIVPGVSTPMDATLKMPHWKALSHCLAILTSRKDWAEKIIDVWMKVEEEDYKGLLTVLERAPRGNSPAPSVDKSIVAIAENRGLIRLAILRLISTLTHAAESCGVTNAEIESLLRIAYTASRRIRRQGECRNLVDYLSHVELSLGNDDSTAATQPTQGPKVLFKIASECVLGPTALARLLVVLAQRKALDAIQGLKKPPNGLSSYTSLHHVQQITHPAVIQRFLTIALERVLACTEKGRNHFSQRRYGPAQISFTCSAELAAALIAFDAHTDGQYSNQVRGTRKELVIALSNASAAALSQKEYLEAECFGLGAITAAENFPASEGLDPGVVEKCKRRVKEAQKFVRERH